MVLVFTAFAALSGLVSLLFPHLAGGLGEDMTLIYLLLALLCAMLRLLKRGGPRKG